MKKLLIALALLFGAVIQVSPAMAKTHWVHYGADHAYKSKAAAKANAASVMRRAGWSEDVVSAMTAKMQEAPDRIELRKGDHLDFMRSGASALWRDVDVAFQPITHGIAVVASADSWSVTVAGVTYELIIPDVCNNISGRVNGRMVHVRRAVRRKNPCQYADFQSVNETAMVVQVRDPNDVCLAMRDTTDFSVSDNGQGWKPVLTDCGAGNCIKNPIGAGKHQIRFSPGNEPAICLDFNGDMSFKNQVRTADMQPTASGELHAYISRESKEIPIGTNWGDPGSLAFWASTQDAAEKKRASFQR